MHRTGIAGRRTIRASGVTERTVRIRCSIPSGLALSRNLPEISLRIRIEAVGAAWRAKKEGFSFMFARYRRGVPLNFHAANGIFARKHASSPVHNRSGLTEEPPHDFVHLRDQRLGCHRFRLRVSGILIGSQDTRFQMIGEQLDSSASKADRIAEI